MNAIVKKKLRFSPPPGVEGKTIIVSPLAYPQQLPDWVKKAAGYEHCISGDDPAIVEVVLKKLAPKEFVESKATAEGTATPGRPLTPEEQAAADAQAKEADGAGADDSDSEDAKKAKVAGKGSRFK